MRSVLSLIIPLLCGAFWLTAPELPRPSPAGPVVLLPGLGNHHHAIATKNAEAQKFFDQGLTLNFGLITTKQRVPSGMPSS